jgi:hypothetical protein
MIFTLYCMPGKALPSPEEADPPIILVYLLQAPAFINKMRLLFYAMGPYFLLHFVALPAPLLVRPYTCMQGSGNGDCFGTLLRMCSF